MPERRGILSDGGVPSTALSRKEPGGRGKLLGWGGRESSDWQGCDERLGGERGEGERERGREGGREGRGGAACTLEDTAYITCSTCTCPTLLSSPLLATRTYSALHRGLTSGQPFRHVRGSRGPHLFPADRRASSPSQLLLAVGTLGHAPTPCICPPRAPTHPPIHVHVHVHVHTVECVHRN